MGSITESGGSLPDDEPEEFVTIIAPSMLEVMAEFRARGLAALGYAIVGRAGWHRFRVTAGQHWPASIDGRRALAATFRRAGASSRPPGRS